MRLNRYIALTSGLSRRAADDAIAARRVQINGVTALITTELKDGQTVTLDGKVLSEPDELHYYMLHKPVGYVCSRTQQGSDKTIYALLPEELHDLKSVGRLDRDSSGLLLLSDDGEFIHRNLHPSFGKRKRYKVILSKPIAAQALAQLKRGVTLADGQSRLEIESYAGKHITVSLEEGRNRQIRRTFSALGFEVTGLHRTDFGSFELGTLAPGELRQLTLREVGE